MDADKLKNFFIYHGEKFVVAIVIAASSWMVYSGLNMPDMRDEQQPGQLTDEANRVRSSIDDDHNEAILPDRTSDLFDIVAETLKKQSPVDPSPYKLPNLLERQEIDSSLRRGDPVLLAPMELMTSGHIETIAVLGGRNRIESLETADELEVVEKVAPRPTRNSRGRGRNRMDMDMGMDMGMDMDMDMGMDMDMDMGMDMMGMGGESMAMGPNRKFDPKFDFGYKAGAAVSSSGTGGKSVGPRSAWFIAGTALLPHKQIAEAYRAALSDADGYTPARDQPLYFNYEIQRAEVTKKPVDQLEDADWILVGNRENDLKRAAYEWAGFAPELVPADYRDVNLTGYIPPVLLSDYSKFALHPKIPMVGKSEIRMQELMESQGIEEEINPDDLELAGPGATGMAGMGGYDMDMDMEMDMDMGMGMGMMMGMGMSASMSMVEEDPVEYKIMRFYDFARGGDAKSPLPGRKYVYRLRFAVQDPNFPANPLQQPKSSTLMGDVYTRIQELMKNAEETKKRDFQRWSPWSEPSPVASLPGLNRFYAGPVEQPRLRSFQVAGKEVQYAKTPPTGKLLNYTHNTAYATVMPIWMEKITEGSALAFEGEAELIDPISLDVKKTPDAKVLSGSTVIDIEGGQSLEIADKDSLTRPGLMLIFDEFGGLRVSNEVDDQQNYRIYSFADQRGL